MQAETEGNEITQSAVSQSPSDVDSSKNISTNSERQRLVQIHQAENLPHLPSEENFPQIVGISQQALHNITGQEHLHQIASSEANMNTVRGNTEAAPTHGMSEIQNSATVVDIAAPEVRTRVRLQDEDVVVLQSTFTQTYPLPEEPKKV